MLYKKYQELGQLPDKPSSSSTASITEPITPQDNIAETSTQEKEATTKQTSKEEIIKKASIPGYKFNVVDGYHKVKKILIDMDVNS
jgi:hypothetical protein